MKYLLTFLICVIASATTMHAGYDATEKFSQSYPLAERGGLLLENVNGSIEIVAWDKTEISIEAEKRARRSEDLQRIVIHTNATPDRLTIKTEHKRSGWFIFRTSGEVRYKIKVPSGCALRRIENVNGSISIRGVGGPITAHTVNGGVHVEGLTASASLESVNGSVSARVKQLPAGQSLDASTVNGSCTLTLPASIEATVRAETVNGRISSVLPITVDKADRRKLHGRIGAGPSASIKAETVNGDITLESD